MLESRYQQQLFNCCQLALSWAGKERERYYSGLALGLRSPFASERSQNQRICQHQLKQAIQNNALELHYQPQVNLKKTAVLYGVEALIRWPHPILGYIPPTDFIPIAEATGLIGDVSEWVIKTACQQLKSWRQNHINIATISINLSPLDFHNNELPHLIGQHIQANGLQPSDIIIEITENILLENSQTIIDMLHRLRRYGLRLGLDDFGSGYSSLSYLHRLPIQELKLDRGFISDLETDANCQALYRAIYQIADAMALTVIVEGVETQKQRQMLLALGFTFAQGFLFSPALSAERLEQWLQHETLPMPE